MLRWKQYSILLVIFVSACNTRPPLEEVNQRTGNDAVEEEKSGTGSEDFSPAMESIRTLSNTALGEIDSLNNIQTTIATLDSEISQLEKPTDYAASSLQLDEQIALRETKITELEVVSQDITDQMEKLQQQISLEKQDNPDGDATKWETEFLALQEQTSNSLDSFQQSVQAIKEFDQALATRLEAPAVIGPFTYEANNPTHYRSNCQEGSISRIQARTGLLVDQLTTFCNGVGQIPVGGNGGDPVATPIQCENGLIAKGLFGSAGDAMDSVGLICAPSVDSAQTTKTLVFGNPDGGEPFEIFCPARTILIGIAGSLNGNAEFLVSIYPVCRKLPASSSES